MDRSSNQSNYTIKCIWTARFVRLFSPTDQHVISSEDIMVIRMKESIMNIFLMRNQNTVEPLVSGHPRDQKKCPLTRGVRLWEVSVSGASTVRA